MTDMDKAAKVLVSAFVGAVVVAIFGDMLVYDPAVSNESIAPFETGSTGATFVEYAPLILIALGFLGAYQQMD